MEAYLNFGAIGGAMAFVILGAAIQWLYLRMRLRGTIMATALYLATMSSLVLWMRNTVVLVPRTVLWTVLLAAVVERLVSRRGGRVTWRAPMV